MRLVPNQPIFIRQNGCPSNSTTNFVGIIIDKKSNPDAYSSIAELLFVEPNPKSICQNNINPNHIKTSLSKADLLFALFQVPVGTTNIEYQLSKLGRRVTIFGFATIFDKRLTSNNTDNSLYIDLICGFLPPEKRIGSYPAPGKTLLNLITEYGKQNDYRYISLSALLNVVNYYRKFGFRHIHNGQTTESKDVARLAELNKSVRLDDTVDADDLVKLELALRVSTRIVRGDKVDIDMETLQKELQKLMNLDDKPDEEEIYGEYFPRVPEHVFQSNGHDGLFDLVTVLMKNGFSTDDGCQNLTGRSVVTVDDEYAIVNCTNSGFMMRKPLFPETEEPGLDSPVIQCEQSAGRSRPRKRYTRKHNVKRPRSSRKIKHRRTKGLRKQRKSRRAVNATRRMQRK